MARKKNSIVMPSCGGCCDDFCKPAPENNPVESGLSSRERLDDTDGCITKVKLGGSDEETMWDPAFRGSTNQKQGGVF